jgi:hypothetical protein
MNKKQILNLLIWFPILSTTSCATQSQFINLENQAQNLNTKVSDLSIKVDNFSTKYSEILNENKMLKDRLQDKVPIVSVKSNGIIFDVIKAEIDGKDLKIELMLTNKNDFDVNIGNSGAINVVDDLGNQYKVSSFIIGKGANQTIYPQYQTIYTDVPIKCLIIAENINNNAQSIGVLGFTDIYETIKSIHFKAALKNIKITK